MRSATIALTVLLGAALGAVQSSTIQPAQLQQDFDVLKRALEEAHGGLYRYTPKAELEKAFAASRARLSRPMTRLEFGALLSEALAAIRDGHTRLEYDEVTTKALSSARLLPLRMAHEGGRLVVVGNDSSVDRSIRPAPDGGFLVKPELHPGVAEQKPAAVSFPGKVVVLIDGGSFSTTADVAAQLRSRTQAVFIGEETAGAAEGDTSGLNAQVTLPNSGLRLKIQMYGYWNALGTAGRAGAPALCPGRGTLPDVTIVRTVANVLAGIDPVLQQAMALLRDPK